MKKILLAALLFLVGCAPYASNITPSAISSARYDGWSCDELKAEQRFVEESLTRVSADQDSAAGHDILIRDSDWCAYEWRRGQRRGGTFEG